MIIINDHYRYLAKSIKFLPFILVVMHPHLHDNQYKRLLSPVIVVACHRLRPSSLSPIIVVVCHCHCSSLLSSVIVVARHHRHLSSSSPVIVIAHHRRRPSLSLPIITVPAAAVAAVAAVTTVAAIALLLLLPSQVLPLSSPYLPSLLMAVMAAMTVMTKKRCTYLMSLQFCASFALNPCISSNGVEGKVRHRAGKKETIESSHPFWMLHRFGIGVCYCSRLCVGVGKSLLTLLVEMLLLAWLGINYLIEKNN